MKLIDARNNDTLFEHFSLSLFMCVTLNVHVLKLHWMRIFMNRLSSTFLVFPPKRYTTISSERTKKKTSTTTEIVARFSNSIISSSHRFEISCDWHYGFHVQVSASVRHHTQLILMLIILSSLMSVYFSLSLFFHVHSGACMNVCLNTFTRAIETCIRTTCY